MHSSSKPLTRDACRRHLVESTFRLRPSDWTVRYPKWPGATGLEIEMLPVFAGQHGQPKSVPLQGGSDALAGWLRSLASEMPGWTTENFPESDVLASVTMDEGDKLTFEPGGQLEFSSVPYPCLADASRRMTKVQMILDRALAERGVELVQLGVNPWHTVEGIGLQMQKPRYRAMNAYFAAVGPWGQRMMRQTCTVQVNLDFGADEQTMARRFLAAQLIAPIAGATFANSGFVDGSRADVRAFRPLIWLGLDGTRTGIPAGLDRVSREWSRESCVAVYEDFLMSSRVVFIESLGFKVPPQPLTWSEWLDTPFEGVSPTQKDLETQLSLLFPEVRARGFLELRSVDCQARAWQIVPAAWWTGLLYDAKSLSAVLDLLIPSMGQLGELMREVPRGLGSPRIASLAPKVMQLAIEGFSRLAPCFQGEGSRAALELFARHFTSRLRSPVDDLIDAARSEPSQGLGLAVLRRVETGWNDLLARSS
jgi:glutamate--cysteine ligase